ncbi:solute carrier family 2, facilitated glucose transporter member 10-like, partial [Ostrinia furnacalis]|uniref:solute carrier family 2, facilitated glucose transporter member 10-like n=1 Tax=Ostrinia furnacalis TaxID=93504 RepID=UPI00103E0297
VSISSCGILFAYAAGGMLSAHALSLSMAAPPSVLLVSLLWLPETPSFLISVGRIQDAAKVICWFDGSDFREDLTDVIEQQEVKIRTSDCYGRREAMRRQDSDTFQPMLKRSSGLDSNCDKKAEQSACRKLFRHRVPRRALCSCMVLVMAAAGSGAGAVNSFAAAVLRHTAHTVPRLNLTAYNFTIYNGTVPRPLLDASEAGSMLCGAALVLGAAVATITVDKLGRKMLLLWSCSGIACCLAILGVYCDPRLRMYSWYPHRLWPYRRSPIDHIRGKHIEIPQNLTAYVNDNVTNNLIMNTTESEKSWHRIGEDTHNSSHGGVLWGKKENDEVKASEDETMMAPILLLSVVLFLYNIGLGSVPYVLISELFSINVRSLASSFIISWMWLSSFLLLRYYGTIAVSLGLHSTYYIGAGVTLLGSLYTLLFIPETKGKSQEQIDEELEGPWIVLKKKKNRR